MPLARARLIANQIVEKLTEYCERIEVAGSIRRGKPVVSDVDIVVLLKPGRELAFRERCKQKAKQVVTDAEQTLVVILENNIQVDIWLAQPPKLDLFRTVPGTFGTLLLCRTGSPAHNIYLLEHAKSLGLRWNTYHGVYDGLGNCVAAETEEDIFKALKLDFVPPEWRER